MRNRVLLPLVASLVACVQTDPEEQPDRYQLDIAETLFDDAKHLDLGDLVWGTGRLATDAVNGALRAIPYNDSRLSYTELFGLEERAAQDLTIRSLPGIATGLATRFGENTLPAQVAEIRREHLRSSGDTLYAETAFRLGANFDHGIGQSVPGLDSEHDAWVGVGFGTRGDLEARVVTAHHSEADALRHAPLESVMNVRGFIMPRDVDDIRTGMKPGESLALGGHGELGLNFGVGVPLLVANPAQSVTYSIVLSAGASTRLSGDLDVQVVRLDGQEAILDVGLRNARVENAYVRIDDSFGIAGLIESHVTIGPFDIDLGKLAQRALERELNRRLSLISARAEGTRESVRESVARFRIDLSQVGQAGRVAIEEAFKGDIRLAQSLAARGQEGLTAEIDLMRAGKTTYGYLGLNLLGMRFFDETEHQEGEAVLQTPGGSLAVLFDSLRHESGSFFSEHGYARTAMAGVEVGADGVPRSQTNLYFAWKEGDDYMERDKMLDHLDGLLAVAIGTEQQARVSALLDEVGRATQAMCAGMSNFDGDNGRAYRACKMNVLTKPSVLEKVDAARNAFATALQASELSRTEADVAQRVFDLALAGERAFEPQASLAGPPTDISVSTWLSDDAIGELMSGTTGGQIKDRIFALALAAAQERERSNGPERARRDLRDEQSTFDGIARRYDGFRRSYLDLVDIANANVDGVGTIGDMALLVNVPVSADNVLQYEDLVVRSVARRRTEVIAELIDKLLQKIGDVDDDDKPERILGPALVSLTRPALRNYAADVYMNLEDNWAQGFPQYIAAGYAPLHVWMQGPQVRLIGGDLSWDVARLVNLDR